MLRDHVVFDQPNQIDRTRTIRRNVQTAWREKLDSDQADFVPLVDDVNARYDPGWVSYENTLEGSPEIEVLCGGDNSKTPAGAAVWRQGNLLHFGFEQSPGELNETGRALLENAIVYIARFTEDRPIARVPSPFAGAVFRPRDSLAGWLKGEDYPLELFTEYLAEQTRAGIQAQTREEYQKWFEQNRALLRPDDQAKLVVDEDLRTLGVHYDRPEFFDRAIAALEDPQHAPAARRVLARFAPEGPGLDASADAWAAWHDSHRPYLFYLERGGYRWYVDPLAKKRGIPTAELRGPDRADQQRATAAP